MRAPRGDWTDVFLAFRLSLDVRKLWLAFKGVVLSVFLVGLALGALACLYHALGVRFRVADAAGPARGQGRVTYRRVYAPVAGDELPAEARYLDTDVWGSLRRGRLGSAVRATGTFAVALARAAWDDFAGRFPRGIDSAGALVRVFWLVEPMAEVAFLALGVWIVLLFIWSYYGAAIMRLAAVEYAVGEPIEYASAQAYARRKHHCFYGSPLVLMALMLVFAVGIMVLGALAAHFLVVAVFFLGLLAALVAAAIAHDRAHSLWAGAGAGAGGLAVTIALCALLAHAGWRIPYVGGLVAGLLSPFAVLLGLAMAIMAIWVFFGLGLMFGALASSDGDLFDAWSRSFHYLFNHPWLYAFTVVVATGYGAACLAFVYLVRGATECAMLWPLSAGLLGRFELVGHYMAGGAPLVGGRGDDQVLAYFLLAIRVLLDLGVLAFAATFKLAALTIIYFVLRKRADGTPVSEVHLEPRDREFLYPKPAAETP